MKKKLFTALTLILILTLALTGCGKENKKAEKSKAEIAIENIKKIDTKDYFTEDMKDVESLIDKTVKKLEKAEENDVPPILKSFNANLSKIPTRSASLKAFEDKLNEEIEALGDDKEKAEEVIKSYLEKIKNVKSKAELEKLSSEITGKIEEATGKEVADIKVSEVTETAVKEAPKEQAMVISSGNSGSGNASTPSNNTNSGNVSKPSDKPKPSKPSNSQNSKPKPSPKAPKQEKKPRVVHHEEQGHWETKIVVPEYQEPVYETRIVTSDGKIFDTADEAGEYLASFDFEDPNAPQNYSSKQVQVGTKTHPAVTKKVWIVDKAAYYEAIWE